MSFLDIDERLLDFCEIAEFNRSPLTDIKHCEGVIDIGLIEGGLCNAENVETLREFRAHCRILVAVGACAINGGIPAMRNHISLKAGLEEAYMDGIGVVNPQIPNDPELPLLLEKVHPIHEVVTVDYVLPGCPPSADVFWSFLSDIAEGREPSLPPALIRFD
jgi:NAD-reducing hydrogenase small subunit